MRTIILSLSLLCLWTASSGAVSRVGGGKVGSQSSGFEMQVPQNFAGLKKIGAQVVRAEGSPVYLSGRGITIQFVDITEFSQDFQDLVGINREDLRQRLAGSHWEELSTPQACALIMKNNNPEISAIIATWGDGKGFVLKGRNLPDVNAAMQTMLESLSVEPGACVWK